MGVEYAKSWHQAVLDWAPTCCSSTSQSPGSVVSTTQTCFIVHRRHHAGGMDAEQHPTSPSFNTTFKSFSS